MQMTCSPVAFDEVTCILFTIESSTMTINEQVNHRIVLEKAKEGKKSIYLRQMIEYETLLSSRGEKLKKIDHEWESFFIYA